MPFPLSRSLVALALLLLCSLAVCTAQPNGNCSDSTQFVNLTGGASTSISALPVVACNSTAYASYVQFTWIVSASPSAVCWSVLNASSSTQQSVSSGSFSGPVAAGSGNVSACGFSQVQGQVGSTFGAQIRCATSVIGPAGYCEVSYNYSLVCVQGKSTPYPSSSSSSSSSTGYNAATASSNGGGLWSAVALLAVALLATMTAWWEWRLE